MSFSFYARGATRAKAAADLEAQVQEEGAALGFAPKLTALLLASGRAHLRALPDPAPEGHAVVIHFFGSYTEAGTDLQISARYTRIKPE
jgi:hypothetical protein